MYIRLFANTGNDDEALKIFKDIISVLLTKIKVQNIIKIEPYWKMEDVYEIEAEIELSKTLEHDELQQFLNSISDKWLYFGEPLNEVLTSETTEGCTFLKKDIKMINIIL